MPSVGSVSLLLVLGHDFGFELGMKYVDVQEFVAQPAGERFHERILQRRARVNEHDPCRYETLPVHDRV